MQEAKGHVQVVRGCSFIRGTNLASNVAASGCRCRENVCLTHTQNEFEPCLLLPSVVLVCVCVRVYSKGSGQVSALVLPPITMESSLSCHEYV